MSTEVKETTKRKRTTTPKVSKVLPVKKPAVKTVFAKRGDTLESLAEEYSVSLASLRQLNPATKIYIGMPIRIPE